MLLFLLLLYPPAEIMLTLAAGRAWGWGPVLALMVASFVAGSLLIRLRGAVFFRKAMASMEKQEMPAEALVGGIAWYVAGILLMIPGLVSDVLALVVLLPPVRRRVLARFQKAAEARLMGMQAAFMAGNGWQEAPGSGNGEVFEGEAREVQPVTPAVSLEEREPPR